MDVVHNYQIKGLSRKAGHLFCKQVIWERYPAGPPYGTEAIGEQTDFQSVVVGSIPTGASNIGDWCNG